jgi:hypothetical protein
MCLANISGVLGDTFRFVYSRICCRLCQKKKKKSISNGKIEKSSNNNGSVIAYEDENLEDDKKVTVPLTVSNF